MIQLRAKTELLFSCGVCVGINGSFSRQDISHEETTMIVWHSDRQSIVSYQGGGVVVSISSPMFFSICLCIILIMLVKFLGPQRWLC